MTQPVCVCLSVWTSQQSEESHFHSNVRSAFCSPSTDTLTHLVSHISVAALSFMEHIYATMRDLASVVIDLIDLQLVGVFGTNQTCFIVMIPGRAASDRRPTIAD